MSVGTFIIQEKPELGGLKPRGGAVRFEWDSDHRSSPIQPWSGGVKQRSKRTDYAGADAPTEQVLGPNFKPFTLSGRWQDKYNGGAPTAEGQLGFAMKTFNAFLAMVRRGNITEISYKSMSFIGLITDFDWDYRREYDISYSFTVSPHRRPGVDELAKPPSPEILLDANTLAKRIAVRVDAMKALEADKPTAQLAGDTSPQATEKLAAVEEASKEFQGIVDQRVLKVDSDSNLSVRRAVASGDLLIGRAKDQIDSLRGIGSASLMYQTPLGVLNLEVWSRGVSASARLTVFDSFKAREQLDRQADPDAVALYRPFENESLYSISNQFYGTPNNWREIKQRNRLESSNMKGTELLVIPEVPLK